MGTKYVVAFILGLFLSIDIVSANSDSVNETFDNFTNTVLQSGDGDQSDSPGGQDMRRLNLNLRPNQLHGLTLNRHPQQNNKPNGNLHPLQLHRPNLINIRPPLHNRPSINNTRPQQHRPNIHQVLQNHLTALNLHRYPNFYYRPPPRPGQGSQGHVHPTPHTHNKDGSIPTVERPPALNKYKRMYKKWWNTFHADLTTCGTQHGLNPLFRVIGGRISSIKSWPWMVSMFSTLINQPWCAGTLIANDWVVTAAHCFNFVFSDPATWTLHFGKQNASGSAEYPYEQVRTIQNVTIHSDYKPESEKFAFDNDIALIKLDRTVVFSDYTAPLCLVRHADHVTDHVVEDRECTITGYGIANKTHSLHEINLLHVAHVPLIDKQTCAGLEGYGDKLTKNMVCAGFDTGAVDTCKGDSGGPIQCKVGEKWYLVGVTSWGGRNYEGCAEPNEPGAYTDLSHYTEWIYTKIFNDYIANNN